MTSQWLNKEPKPHCPNLWSSVQIPTFSSFLNVNWIWIMDRFHLNKTEFIYLNLNNKRDKTIIFRVKSLCVCNKFFPKEHDLWLWMCMLSGLVKVQFSSKSSVIYRLPNENLTACLFCALIPQLIQRSNDWQGYLNETLVAFSRIWLL